MSGIDYSSIQLGRNTRQIRLLHILPRVVGSSRQDKCRSDPAGHTTQLYCSTKNSLLDQNPLYTALSYVWGPKDDPKVPIVVNRATVLVGRNLATALQYLRNDSYEVVLWADAICINQEDDIEKSHQIQLMKEIYEKATSIVAWLGIPTTLSDLGMDLIEDIGKYAMAIGVPKMKQSEFAHLTDPVEGSVLWNVKAFAIATMRHSNFGAIVAALNDIYTRKLFSRLWIVQEFSVASGVIVVCGEKSTSLSCFAYTIAFLELWGRLLVFFRSSDLRSKGMRIRIELFKFLRLRLASVMLSSRRLYQSGTPQPLLELLIQTHELGSYGEILKATNAKDHIYSLLGISKDRELLNIIPDYSKPCSQIYTEVATTLLAHGNVSLLYLCQHADGFCELPSWVPDWRIPIHKPYSGRHSHGKSYYLGNALTNPEIRFTLTSTPILHISGFRLDTITSISTPFRQKLPNRDFNWKTIGSYLDAIEAYCHASSRYKSCYLDAILRIPLADLIIEPPEYTPTRAKRRRDEAALLEGYVCFRGAPEVASRHADTSLKFSNYLTSMGNQSTRRPFLTESGWVGLAPTRARVGDVIAVFRGCRVPFVIRPHNSQANQSKEGWKLIGEAYVHGAMDGEAMSMGIPYETLDLY